ncbi:Leucine rich repeat variant [uncultured Caudovirales phage]|uniref:Leucine rich repeat variant n=1 Tax=uncultured Caudovirales phage TaxID=2100421 RepID=A0A6J7WZX8_9CAUD|nr:Leucine rich repeat variant [uncultured Caudovirales phage]
MLDLRLSQWLNNNEHRLATPYGVEQVAKHTHTPSSVLVYLVANDNAKYRVKAYVAANPNTPADTLATLAMDDHEMVQANALENPRCPLHVLNSHPLTAHLPKCQPISL